MKKCADCGTEKSDNDFYRYQTEGKKLQPYCKDCHKTRNWQSNLKMQFGIMIEEYRTKLAEQDGLCAICRKSDPTGRRLAVDHDHDTDQIRGLLCQLCNPALGSFQDSPDLLRKALIYLKKWGKE